jgi:hypothetical protein
MEIISIRIPYEINYMKKIILMACTALFALVTNAQQKEVKNAPPKLVKVEKGREVKTPPAKRKFHGKTPPKILKKKFAPPPPPPEVSRESAPPPPPPAKNYQVKKKH